MVWAKNITRRPISWVLFVVLSLGCLVFAIKYFSKAMPLVSINIKIDRKKALEKAGKLAKKFNLGPTDYSQAASFKVDQQTKVFAELECGGQKAFVSMMEEDLYMPYTWVVRHFKEFETNETYIKFTPDGTPYGFKEKIAEDKKGPNLEKEQAQAIAEQTASSHWGVIFSDYKLVEASKEIKPNKRGDHTLVYERKDKNLGDGLYRLKIMVSGDKVTEIKYFVKIPESFTNKYTEMRAANSMIAYIASFLMILLYLVGGCILGLYFLFKDRFVLFRTPIYVGAFMALLFFLSRLNVIPSAWMSYKTVSSSQNFLINYIISSFIYFLTRLFLFILSFMAAESLTRKAFGHHIRFWDIWSKNKANSIAVAGRTVSGYLLPSILLAYLVGVYMFSTKLLGWWIPSGELVDPNILSHYLPWLTSFTNSLGAGFWEECLFRAVPLSCAALLGKRFGKKNWWIAAAFVLQAVIFGAAHATYPAQPAYARLVELILPSFMFAGVYLSFGLLPSIITHFIFDLMLMSIPLFVSSSQYAWVNQLIVILLGLIPLIIVLISRIKAKKWSEIQEEDLNKSWQPPKIKIKKEVIKQKITQKIFVITPLLMTLTFGLGILGAAAWVYFTPFEHNATTLNISQQEAITLAQNKLKSREITISKKISYNQSHNKLHNQWNAYPLLAGTFGYTYIPKKETYKKPSNSMQQKFIWQHDKKLYKKLLGTYLNSPQWVVRFVKFTGEREQRAQEHAAFISYINNKATLYRICHKVPEDKVDKKLTEDQARVIAHAQLAQKFKLDPKKLQEVAAQANKLKNRVNWEFIFSDKEVYSQNNINNTNKNNSKSEARVVIKIDGDDVTDAYRYIHVPEKWLRQEENKQNIRVILFTLCYLLIMFLILFAVLLSGKATQIFSKKYALLGAFTYFIAMVILNANSILKTIAHFDPIKPLYNQLLQYAGSLFISTLAVSSLLGIVAGLVHTYHTATPFAKKLSTIITAISLGFFAMGVHAIINFYHPSVAPLWPDFNGLASHIPAISIIITHTIKYMLRTCFAILFVIAANYIYAKPSKNYYITHLVLTLLFIISSTAITGIFGTGSLEPIYFWLIKSILLALLALIIYLLFVRHDHAIIPIIVAVITISDILQQAIFNAFPAIIPISIASSIIISCLSIIWFNRLNK